MGKVERHVLRYPMSAATMSLEETVITLRN